MKANFILNINILLAKKKYAKEEKLSTSSDGPPRKAVTYALLGGDYDST